jgi:hypothetical protein
MPADFFYLCEHRIARGLRERRGDPGVQHWNRLVCSIRVFGEMY